MQASWLIGKSSACHAGGRRFKSQQGRELLILTKKEFDNLNLNWEFVRTQRSDTVDISL